MDSNIFALVFMLVALVLFIIETIRSQSLIAAGLALLTLAFVFQTWPAVNS